jgi:hypothetical protein
MIRSLEIEDILAYANLHFNSFNQEKTEKLKN